MPIYDVYCKHCGKVEEIFRKLANFDQRPDCCGEKTVYKLNAPFVHEDIKAYKSQLTGEMITSRVRHRNHLKEHGCIEVGNEQVKPPVRGYSKAERYQLRKDLADRLQALRK